MAEGKKASQFKQNATTGYETSVYIILNLGPGSPTDLVEVEKETWQFKQNAATLYQASCVQTLGPDCGKWNRKPANSSRMLQFCNKHPCTIGECSNVLCVKQIRYKPWDLTVAVEKKASQFKRICRKFFYETSVYRILTLGPGSQRNLVEVEKEARQFKQNAAIFFSNNPDHTSLLT